MDTPITVLNTKLDVNSINLTYGLDNTLNIIKSLPYIAIKTFVLTGRNDRMGLLVGDTVGYLILKDTEKYAVIIAVTKSGIKTRTYENGILKEWV